MRQEERAAVAALISERRQAALGTLGESGPFVSMVLYALEQGPRGPAFVIHTSRLAAHTRHLEAEPRASLLIAEPDTGAGDPQALPRVTVQVRAEIPTPGSEAHTRAREAYLARLPEQAYLFEFPDFRLMRLILGEARYVGGFARAFTITPQQLREILAGPNG